MKIQFEQLEEQHLPGFKGGEGELLLRSYSDSRNKIMKGRLAPGASIGMHTHTGNSEIIYILSGTGKALYDGETERLLPGQCHYCPKGHSHSLINDGTEELRFFAAVPEQ